MEKQKYSFYIPHWDELPQDPLYMEQMLTYINSELGPALSDIGLSPITKSMVNNYVKAHFVEAPVNKKYSRQSIGMIIVMYIFKSCYSTDEVGKLIQLGLSFDDTQYTYDTLIGALEAAVKKVFEGQVELDAEKIGERKYLVDNFALSFACKLYASKVFLSAGNNDPA